MNPILLLSLAATNARPPQMNPSAIRLRSESYLSHVRTLGVDTYATSAYGASAPLGDLKIDLLPEWESLEMLEENFKAIRDMRFMKDPNVGLRRSTWIYPDDGCYARAALAIDHLAGKAPTPFKAFIFGDLWVETQNSPYGGVGWWYHVVPILRVGQTAFALDPAIEPSRALTLNEWVRRMTSRLDSVTASFCNPRTYLPGSACENPSQYESSSDLADQRSFLKAEWSRIVNLGRDPEAELGDHPPW